MSLPIPRSLRWALLVVALLGAAALARDALYDALWQRPPTGGTVVVPDTWLRRWDPITVFFPTARGTAGPEDRPERFLRLTPDHPGAYTWLDARTLQFRPADPWPALGRFDVTAGDATASLATLLAPPTGSSPYDGETERPPVDSMRVTFADPVPPAVLARMAHFELRPLPGVGAGPVRHLDAADFAVRPVPRGRPDEPYSYDFRFTRPIPDGTRVRLRLGLADDPRAQDEAATTITFATRIPFRIRSLGCPGAEVPVAPEGTRYPQDQPLACSGGRRVVVAFTAAPQGLGPVQARDLVRLEPPVDHLEIEVSGERLLLTGDFLPEVPYRLAVVPVALQDEARRPLEISGESVTWLWFPTPERSLRFVQTTGLAERFGPRRVPVEGRGHARADLRIYRVDPLNRSFWPFPDSAVDVAEDRMPPGPGEVPDAWEAATPIPEAEVIRRLSALGSPAFSGLIDLPLGATRARFGLDLAPYLQQVAGKDAPGHYLVGLRTLDGDHRTWMRLQVTDLALTTVERENAVRFVVTALGTGKPVAGADVVIEGAVGAGDARRFTTIAKVTTDAEGVATWTAAARGEGNPTVGRLVVRKGDDVLVLDPHRGPESFHDDYWSSYNAPWLQRMVEQGPALVEAPADRAHLFTERPVYRPEEPVHLKGWLRTARRGRLVPVTGDGFVRIAGPGGGSWRLPVSLSKSGTFYAKFEEADRPTGVYTATYEDARGKRHGQVTFTLDAYRLPTFKLGLFGDDPVPLDRPFVVTGIADYYAGGRVAEQPVRWRVTQYPYTWKPAARPGFVYSVDARFSRGARRFESTPALTRVAVTDLEGRARLTLDPGLEPSAWPRTYVIEATVTGADDQTVTQVKRVRALPAFALGLKAPRFLDQARSIPIEVIAVDGNGAAVVGQPLKVHVKHRQWHAHLQATDFSQGEARYVTDTVDVAVETREIVSAAEPVKLDLPISRAGVYLIEVEGQDRLGRAQVVGVDLYAAGPEAVAWAPPEAGTFRATPDKGEHAPGEVAKLVLESPFQTAEALVIVEGPDANAYQRVAVRGGQAVVEVPIDRSYTPRVPVHVVLLRGRGEAPEPAGGSTVDLGRPDLAATTTWLAVKPVDHLVDVAVTLPEAALPGQQIPLDLKLTDPQGKPTAGEVTLWLVDQAVLDLGTEQPLDAIPDFLVPRSSGVAVRDTRKLALGRIPYTQMPGGDGGDDDDPLAQATIRRDFRPVPYYEPALQVGENGQARVVITLPDNLTRFAVRAKVIAGDRFGFATGHIDVRLPVLAQAVLPRFVRPGDEVAAGVIGRVVEGPVGAGAAQLDVEGGAILGEAKAALDFGADKLARADFTLRVDGAARSLGVTLGVRRDADGAADAARIDLPVQPDRRPETRSGVIALTPGEAATIPAVEGAVRPGTLARRVAVTDQPAILRAAGALEGLARRSGGATGARIARARAFLAAAKLRESLGFLGDDLLREAVRETIEYVGQTVDGDGRVAAFPGVAGQVHLTAAAVLLLAEARAAGFPPPRRLWDRLTETLRQALRSDYTGFVQGAAWVERGAALEALAAAGRLDAAYLDELGRLAGSLGPEAAARAILAAKRGGLEPPPALAQALHDAVRTEVKGGQTVYAGLGGFGQDRDPVLRADETAAIAVVARALQAAAPTDDALPVLSATLLRLADAGGFGSAEADAEALLALQALPPPGAGAGLEVALAGADPLVLAPEQPVVVGPLAGAEAVTARLTRGGPAELAWWSTHTPAGPGAEAPASQRGFVVTRTWRRVQAGDAPPVITPIAEAGATLQVKVGDVVEEDVQIVNPADRVYVAIELPLAAGLEPLNPALATAPPEAKPSRGPTLAPDYVQILDDRAVWYFVRLPRGTFDLYLRTQATTPGRFQQPGAVAEALFDRALFGQSPGARVEVQR